MSRNTPSLYFYRRSGNKYLNIANLYVLGYLGAPAHIFKGVVQKKNHAAGQHASVPFIYEASVSAHKIMSEAWNLTTAFEYVGM